MKNKREKYEALFQSNIDYDATYENGRRHHATNQTVKSIADTEKGLLCLTFVGLDDVVCLISPRGSVQVFYTNIEDLNACLESLRKIAVPSVGETLQLAPKGTYSLVDKIRTLIQEDRISHDMNLSLEELSELTGWAKDDVKNVMPTITNQIYPYGIELKVSRIIAGCARPEPEVEWWLKSVEQALKLEGFRSPDSFKWKENQYFEFTRRIQTDSDKNDVMVVRAFIDGTIVTEAQPSLTSSANRVLNGILEKYAVPYRTQVETTTETTKNPLALFAVLGIVAVGAFIVYRLSRTENPNPSRD